jgi:hypothetical protein
VHVTAFVHEAPMLKETNAAVPLANIPPPSRLAPPMSLSLQSPTSSAYNMASPPSTPPTSLTPRSSISPSDDSSSILELSFEWEVKDGQPVRITKTHNPSTQSSPPTPPDLHYSTARTSDQHEKSPSPAPSISSSSSKMPGLSRSDSASSIQESQSSNPSRSFQRTQSTPTVLAGPSARGVARAVRFPSGDYREGTPEQDEKENILRTGASSEDAIPATKRPSWARGVGAHAMVQRPVGGISTGASSSSQRPLRQIAPGSLRPARMLKGVKYAHGMGAVHEHEGRTSPPRGPDDPTELGEFSAYGLLFFLSRLRCLVYKWVDNMSPVDDPNGPLSAPANGLRSQSHAYMDISPSLSTSAGNRPRRSASLSDAIAGIGDSLCPIRRYRNHFPSATS